MINGLEDVQKAGQENMTRALESFGAFQRSMQTLADETAAYSKTAFEASAAHMEKLLAAKSLEGAFEAQSDFVRTSYEKAVGQATRFSELYMDLMKSATKPFEDVIPAKKK